jgi:hypothetical protein
MERNFECLKLQNFFNLGDHLWIFFSVFLFFKYFYPQLEYSIFFKFLHFFTKIWSPAHNFTIFNFLKFLLIFHFNSRKKFIPSSCQDFNFSNPQDVFLTHYKMQIASKFHSSPSWIFKFYIVAFFMKSAPCTVVQSENHHANICKNKHSNW